MLKDQKIIPAISNHADFRLFLSSHMTYGILMNFQLAQIPDLVDEMKKRGKKVLIHSELIKGLNSDEFGAIYLIQNLQVDGIISSKPKVIDICKKRKVLGILRFFLKDSMSFEQSIEVAKKVQPDYLEVLPAISVGILPEIRHHINCPIMMGGLITTKDQILACIHAGAVAVTTSKPSLWI
ncbi:MAG: glycerol-3-phosphate responsive antiterminator [Acholeplasmataceae bacterium]|nr:glycerol-3-phosphate responsive antiterminator [Acholeplasmataceae bacterium]